MDWTYKVIRERIRNLCTMQSITQLSEEKLGDYINRALKWELIKTVRPIQLNSWYEIELSVGVDTYEVKRDFYESMVKVRPTVYISTTSGRKEDRINFFCNDVEDFYAIYPENLDYTDTNSQGKPTSVLLYDNELLFRKCPDTTYYASFKAMRKPLVYVNGTTTTSNSFTNNDDEPENQEWGQLIVYIVAKAILEELGDVSTLQMVTSLLDREIAKVHSITANWYSNKKTKPRW